MMSFVVKLILEFHCVATSNKSLRNVMEVLCKLAVLFIPHSMNVVGLVFYIADT